MVFVIDIVDDAVVAMPIEDRLRVEALITVIMNFDSDGIDEYDEMVS